MGGAVDKTRGAETEDRKEKDCIYGEERKRRGKEASECESIRNCRSAKVHDIRFNCRTIA